MVVKIKKESVLIRPEDIKPSSKKLEVIGVINPAAIRLPNKDILLYVRVVEKMVKFDDKNHLYSPRMVGEKRFKLGIDRFSKEQVDDFSELDFLFKDGTKRLTFISHMKKVVLDKDGFRVKSIERKPSFFGVEGEGEFGVEDPRMTKFGEKYVMTYVALSKDTNISSSCAVSENFKEWKRLGIIFREQNKDVVIFPEKIRGKYVALNRPEGNFQFSHPDIIISYSKDLELWGRPYQLKLTKKKAWDSGRVGAGPPPIKTEKGWLLIYHGVVVEKEKGGKSLVGSLRDLFKKSDGSVSKYCVGAALLDLKDPKKVLAKAKEPIILPRKKYEKSPYEGKLVVFPTGVVRDMNGKDLLIYCGGGDAVTSVKKVAMKDIFDKLERF